MKERVNILWTGGLDSTCRLVELSLLDIQVQPYYIIDKNRKSLKNELQAMSQILKILKSSNKVRAEICDIIFIDEVKPDAKIYNSWSVLHEKYNIGCQYEFIARFASQNRINLEVGIERSSICKGIDLILRDNPRKESMSTSGVDEYYVDKSTADSNVVTVFQNLRFPIQLFDMTKQQEIEEMKHLGFNDVFENTWFCHNPIFGVPCGHCNPCHDAIREGLGYRIPWFGRVLDSMRNVMLFPLKVIRNLARRIKK